MKKLSMMLALVAVLFFTLTSFAETLDGNYKFSWRSKGDMRDLEGWNGTMMIKDGKISRVFKSADGKTEKFYVSTYTKTAPNTYAMTFTKVYNPKYVGVTHTNKIYLKGKTFTMQSMDNGKTFQEVWKKR